MMKTEYYFLMPFVYVKYISEIAKNMNRKRFYLFKHVSSIRNCEKKTRIPSPEIGLYL